MAHNVHPKAGTMEDHLDTPSGDSDPTHCLIWPLVESFDVSHFPPKGVNLHKSFRETFIFVYLTTKSKVLLLEPKNPSDVFYRFGPSALVRMRNVYHRLVDLNS